MGCKDKRPKDLDVWSSFIHSARSEHLFYARPLSKNKTKANSNIDHTFYRAINIKQQ